MILEPALTYDGLIDLVQEEYATTETEECDAKQGQITSDSGEMSFFKSPFIGGVSLTLMNSPTAFDNDVLLCSYSLLHVLMPRGIFIWKKRFGLDQF